MVTLEQVEKLRERAHVSYEEAKEALDKTGGDLLQAMIYLEQAGKTGAPAGGGSYYQDYQAPHSVGYQNPNWQYQQAVPTAPPYHTGWGKVKQLCARFWSWGVNNYFIVTRRGNEVGRVPVLVFLFLLFFCFYVTLPLMILGLFFDFRYSFLGTGKEVKTMNNVFQDIQSTIQPEEPVASEKNPRDHYSNPQAPGM